MTPPSPPPDLSDQDHRVRMRAIYALVEPGEPHAAEWIRPLLRDRESLVRAAAIGALGQVRDVESFDALVACLAAPMSIDRKSALRALVALGDPRMCEPLVRALQNEPHFPERMKIITVLSMFSVDEEVVNAIVRALEDSEENVRGTAAVALSRMRAVKALPALERMALTDTNHETRINGLDELNAWVAQRAIEIIQAPGRHEELEWPG
jgi:HEAT repeat protein